MSRFIKLVLVNGNGDPVPVQVIANDGNFLVNPVTVKKLDTQGSAERFDIVVDFSGFQPGETLHMVNTIAHKDGRGPDEVVGHRKALRGKADDPAVGPVLQFKVVSEVESVDMPGTRHYAGDPDKSHVPNVLTGQIPIVEPTRYRHLEFKRGVNPEQAETECIPDCGDRESFPWSVKVNGEPAHSLNANRSSLLVPRPGEVEHWTIENGGGGWDHPIHLHFEEGVTIRRDGYRVPATERKARKDVWRTGEGGSVTFQVQFGEFGGAYVSHCHNTVHEDFAMLLRYDVLKDDDSVHAAIVPTPNPTPDGVEFLTPEVLPEGDPRNKEFLRKARKLATK